VDITDPVYILGCLFEGNRDERCLNAMDSDHDQTVSISDAIHLLNFQFLGKPSPALPFPRCGINALDRLRCIEFKCEH